MGMGAMGSAPGWWPSRAGWAPGGGRQGMRPTVVCQKGWAPVAGGGGGEQQMISRGVGPREWVDGPE